ncbi:MAG: hypothetical protein KPEEDBHJ_00448 [Anaerolineales bacterium]|nr:hypothetical protein [Anaerolineales bacterium]
MDVTPAGRQSYTPSIGVTITYENRGTSFVKEAIKLRDKQGSHANPAPFKCYWPTYSDMNGWQQQWYFYWRSQVRQNKFPATDLSYIFVHVYEILNLVETPDPIQAAERIRTLWLAYRGKYPNLDRYLPDWGGDLLAVKVGGAQALAWWESALSVDGVDIPDPLVNTIVEKAIRANGVDALPYKIWSLLSDYQPRNKFYQKYNTNHFVDLSYEKAIKVANTHYLKTTGKSVIDQFVSERVLNYEKPVFASALIGFSHPATARLATGRDYAGSTRLANNITSIMKYAENILRKQLKFSAKLSGIELPADLAGQLDLAFQQEKTQPRKPQPIKITIDHERVASLHEESRVVSEMLATEQAGSEKELLTDLEEVRTLWKSLQVPERKVLAGLLAKEWSTLTQIHTILGMDLEQVFALLEAINKKSQSMLGDKMVYQTADAIQLAEDFIDELEVVVRESPVDQEIASSAGMEEPFNPWVQFFDALDPVEVEVTKLLGKGGQLGEAELDVIARAHNAMANAVMDSLNEKAQIHIGHLPFYPDGVYWLVEEEYLPLLQQHLGLEVN